MKKNDIRKTESDLMYLLSAVVNEEPADKEYILQMDLEKVIDLSMRHMVSAAVCMVLESSGIYENSLTSAPSENQKKSLVLLKDAKEKAIRKEILLDTERGSIFEALDKKQIWYMPLKGIILKEIYPRIGMRQMADNDILFDSRYREDVKNIMLGREYTIMSYGNSVHDTYQKAPIYDFEMHVEMSRDIYDIHAEEYYKDIEAKMIWDEEYDAQNNTRDSRKHFGRHLNCNDTYIYLVCHSYKHYSHGGTGIRTLLDFYCYNRYYEKELDYGYISRELKNIGIESYEKELRNLSLMVFRRPLKHDELKAAIDNQQEEVLNYIFTGGTYGNKSNAMKNDMDYYFNADGDYGREAKSKYCLKRVFPEINWYRMNYPITNRYPVIIPAITLYRLLVRPIVNHKRIINEINILRKL